MLRSRTFLIGLGCGIIMGALLLQLMMIGQQSQNKLSKLGTETDELLYTQADLDALLAAQKDSAQLNEKIEQEVAKQQEQPLKASEAPVDQEMLDNGDEQKNEQEDTEIEAKPVEHVIRIPTGSKLTHTAALLANSNIISDQTKFINEMNKAKKKVRAGQFLFQEGMTVVDVIAVVTGEPLTQAEAAALSKTLQSK